MSRAPPLRRVSLPNDLYPGAGRLRARYMGMAWSVVLLGYASEAALWRGAPHVTDASSRSPPLIDLLADIRSNCTSSSNRVPIASALRLEQAIAFFHIRRSSGALQIYAKQP